MWFAMFWSREVAVVEEEESYGTAVVRGLDIFFLFYSPLNFFLSRFVLIPRIFGQPASQPTPPLYLLLQQLSRAFVRQKVIRLAPPAAGLGRQLRY